MQKENVDLKATPLKRSVKTSFTNLILAKYCKKTMKRDLPVAITIL